MKKLLALILSGIMVALPASAELGEEVMDGMFLRLEKIWQPWDPNFDKKYKPLMRAKILYAAVAAVCEGVAQGTALPLPEKVNAWSLKMGKMLKRGRIPADGSIRQLGLQCLAQVRKIYKNGASEQEREKLMQEIEKALDAQLPRLLRDLEKYRK